MKVYEFKYLSFDVVYKYIFGTNKNKRFIQRFLELYFGYPEGYLKDLVVTNSVKLTPNTIKGRKFETDIIVELPNCDFIVNLEQQNIYDKAARDKNNAYAYGLAYKQFESGKEGNKKVKKVIQLNFVKKFVKLNDLEGNYQMSDIENMKIQEDELVEIRVINVDKYKEKLYNKSNKELDLWLALKAIKSKEELEQVKRQAKKYPLIKEAIEVMKEFESKKYVQELWWHDYLINRRMEEHYEDGFDKGKTTGFNEGRTAGFSEGRTTGFSEGRNVGANERNYEIAKSFLENTDTPIEDIIKCTGLSLEEVNKLKREIKTLAVK